MVEIIGVVLQIQGRLAQLVRASGLHPEGQWFESTIAHHYVKRKVRKDRSYFAFGSETRLLFLNMAYTSLELSKNPPEKLCLHSLT